MEIRNETLVEKGFFKKLMDSVAESVKEGASFFGEKVTETSDKIHDFTEKQILHEEKQKIEARMQVLQRTFGALTLGHYLEHNSLNKPFLASELITAIVQEYKEARKRLAEIATAL